MDAINTAKRNLAEALRRQEADPQADPGPRWSAYGHWLRDNVAGIGSIGELLTTAIDVYGFEHRLRQAPTSSQLKSQMMSILAEFPEAEPALLHLRESSLLQHPSVVGMATDEVSGGVSTTLLALERMHFAASAYCGQPKRICEIGGGYGAPARVWMRSPANPCERYVIIDLPESLFFAEAFLRTEFPEKKIVYAHELHHGPADIVLYPAYLADHLRVDADLILNTLSMPEMSDSWCETYMRLLDRSTARFFYSFNSAGRPLDGMHEHVSLFAPRLSSIWASRLVRAHLQGPRNWVCEAVYERIDNPGEWTAHYQTLFDATQRQVLDPQAYFVSLDCLRYLNDPARTSAFLDRVLRDWHFFPKELLFLAHRIGRSDLVDRFAEIPQAAGFGAVGTVVERHRTGTEEARLRSTDTN